MAMHKQGGNCLLISQRIATALEIPESERSAGNVRVFVVKPVIANGSPGGVVAHLKTPGVGQSVVAGKSHLH